MKKFKCLYYSLFLSLLVFVFSTTSCRSNEPQLSKEVDVSFNISNVTNGSIPVNSIKGMTKVKASDPIINCNVLKADYVKFKIGDGDFQKIPVFYVNGSAWTNSIKLLVGDYVLTEFLVYSDNNTPDNDKDDVLLSATPHINSDYARYVNSPLSQNFTVTVDKKNEITLEVVCFEPEKFTSFGFVYYKLNEIKVRQLWFFADFCIKNKADYDNSDYAKQSGWSTNPGPFIDVPAIMKVEVWRNGLKKDTFLNTFQGKKLSVYYAHYLSQTDAFELKLYILVRQGTDFKYVYFKSWKFIDKSDIPDGGDGVIDGVLGNCYNPATPPDFILAPWMNLPPTATYTTTAWNPSKLGAYTDVLLDNIADGYEIKNGLYPSYCADHTLNINVGESYNMDVYSSLYPDKLPPFLKLNDNQIQKWNKVNWLFNHLDWYPEYLWSDIQGFIWLYDNPKWDGLILGNVPQKSDNTIKMYNYAEDPNNKVKDYKVPPGGWATIIFVKHGTTLNPEIQTVLVKVDP